MNQPILTEKQRLTQWYLYFPLLIIVMLTILGSYFDEHVSFIDITPVILIVIVVGFLLLSFSIKIELYEDKILVNPTWFGGKEIYFTNVSSVIIGTYSFVGYGVRYNTTLGEVLNVKGRDGILFRTSNGDVLVGSQDVDRIYNTLYKHLKSEKIFLLDEGTTIQEYLKK
jgi:hypothetical protein